MKDALGAIGAGVSYLNENNANALEFGKLNTQTTVGAALGTLAGHIKTNETAIGTITLLRGNANGKTNLVDAINAVDTALADEITNRGAAITSAIGTAGQLTGGDQTALNADYTVNQNLRALDNKKANLSGGNSFSGKQTIAGEVELTGINGLKVGGIIESGDKLTVKSGGAEITGATALNGDVTIKNGQKLTFAGVELSAVDKGVNKVSGEGSDATLATTATVMESAENGKFSVDTEDSVLESTDNTIKTALNTLGKELYSEAETREQADTSLGNRIDSLSNDLTAEVGRAQNAEQGLNNRLSSVEGHLGGWDGETHANIVKDNSISQNVMALGDDLGTMAAAAETQGNINGGAFSKDNSVAANLEKLDQAIGKLSGTGVLDDDDENTSVAHQLTTLNTKIGSSDDRISGLETLVGNPTTWNDGETVISHITAAEGNITSLTGRMNTAEGRIGNASFNTANGNFTNQTTSLTDAVNALDTAVGRVARFSEDYTGYAAGATDLTQAIAQVDTQAKANIESINTALGTALSNANGNLVAAAAFGANNTVAQNLDSLDAAIGNRGAITDTLDVLYGAAGVKNKTISKAISQIASNIGVASQITSTIEGGIKSSYTVNQNIAALNTSLQDLIGKNGSLASLLGTYDAENTHANVDSRYTVIANLENLGDKIGNLQTTATGDGHLAMSLLI